MKLRVKAYGTEPRWCVQERHLFVWRTLVAGFETKHEAVGELRAIIDPPPFSAPKYLPALRRVEAQRDALLERVALLEEALQPFLDASPSRLGTPAYRTTPGLGSGITEERMIRDGTLSDVRVSKPGVKAAE